MTVPLSSTLNYLQVMGLNTALASNLSPASMIILLKKQAPVTITLILVKNQAALTSIKYFLAHPTSVHQECILIHS